MGVFVYIFKLVNELEGQKLSTLLSIFPELVQFLNIARKN